MAANEERLLEGFSIALDDFLEALDRSYCTDLDDCGIYTPARVISFSYGGPENMFSKPAQVRQCAEFLKLSLRGVTSIVASGDWGVGSAFFEPGGRNGCIIGGKQKPHQRSANGKVFNPDYPASCPYILSVGGTQLPLQGNVSDPESAMQMPVRLTMTLNGTASSGG